MYQNQLRNLVALLATVVLCGLATAQTQTNLVQIGRNITIAEGEKVGDVVCIACSIRVRGEVRGDVTAVAGHITIEHGAQVAGSVTGIFGGVRLQSGAQVKGDARVVLGALQRDPQTAILGDIASVTGPGGLFLILFVPLLLLLGLTAFIVWLIRRARRPAAAVA